MKNIAQSLKLIFFSLVFVSLLASCKEDEPAAPAFDPDKPNLYVNDWIKKEMDTWYFWTDEIPKTTNKELSPDQYFRSLLSNKDRFSWIQNNYQELLNSLQGVSIDAGYEIRYLLDADSVNNIFGQVLYVKPGSPAASTGIKRGDLITHINGARINTSNYQSLHKIRSDPHNFKYRRYSFDKEGFENSGTINLTPVQFAENPNYLDTIYTLENKKIGYYVYHAFASGPTASSKIYQDEMDAIFQKFKSAGVQELIVDLRYNGGGSLDVAINLGSLMAGGITTASVFSKRKYNAALETAIRQSAELGPSFLENKFTSKTQNIGRQLSKIHFIVSSRSASASEVLINSVKPFTPVVLVGDTTVGKNQGSISLYEENDPNNKWGMQPIVVFIANSKDESDFSDGFAPNIYDRDVSRILYPFGDIRETLLSKTIGAITGIFPARERLPIEFTKEAREMSIPYKVAPIKVDDEQSKAIWEQLRNKGNQ
jgi:C-terminal processing protease CtpA/Prc